MSNESESEICRICLDTKDLQSLYPNQETTNSSTINIINKIIDISGIQISKEDQIPNFICHHCSKKVEDFCEFKELIKNSDSYLRSILCENFEIKADMKENEIFENSKEIVSRIDSDNTENVLQSNDNSCLRNKIISNSKSEDFPSQTLKSNTSKNNITSCNNQNKSKYQCYECGKLLSSHYSLKKHIRTHTGEKPYICLDCKKSFSSAFNLKIHERIHTGEKPLQCQHCSKRFAQPASLVSHQRNHSGELPYKCHMCPRTFKSNSSLKYHIVTHTGEKKFFCSICNRGFITKGDVKNHEKTHSDERPFICPICGLALRRAYGLKRHMQGHKGIKNYECNLCSVAFSQKYDLKRHIETHLKKIKKKELNKIEIENNVEEELNLLSEISLSN